MKEEADGPRGTWGVCMPQSRRLLRNTCLHSTEPRTALWSMINLDALKEQRNCHTSGQQMQVPPSDSTDLIPNGTFEEVSAASRTFGDASNLTVKSVTTANCDWGTSLTILLSGHGRRKHSRCSKCRAAVVHKITRIKAQRPTTTQNLLRIPVLAWVRTQTACSHHLYFYFIITQTIFQNLTLSKHPLFIWRFIEQGEQVWLPGFVFKTHDIKTSGRIWTILCEVSSSVPTQMWREYPKIDLTLYAPCIIL